MIKPLIWNYSDKEDEDHWPKKVIGGTLLFIPQQSKIILIGGNFNAIDNLYKNLQLNTNLLLGIDKDVDKFPYLEEEKIKYINEMAYLSKKKNIDLIIYDMVLFKWERKISQGKVPVARSFHKCFYSAPYIFLYGGIILGPRAENLSVNEFYVMNSFTYEWKQILFKVYPVERTDFTWNGINNNSAVLYGGASSPSDLIYDDIWLFTFDGSDLFVDSKKEITKSYWSKLPSKGKNKKGKVRAHSAEVVDNFLYIFGGIDSSKNCSNAMHRYNLLTYEWELLAPSGKPPQARCYHEMCLISKDYIFISGGITGDLTSMKRILADFYMFNVKDNIWTEAIIGGNAPIERLGFCMVKLFGMYYHNPNLKIQKNFHNKDRSVQLSSLSSSRNEDSQSILILGGYTKANDYRIYELFESSK